MDPHLTAKKGGGGHFVEQKRQRTIDAAKMSEKTGQFSGESDGKKSMFFVPHFFTFSRAHAATTLGWVVHLETFAQHRAPWCRNNA